jgi:hypothetical protein
MSNEGSINLDEDMVDNTIHFPYISRWADSFIFELMFEVSLAVLSIPTLPMSFSYSYPIYKIEYHTSLDNIILNLLLLLWPFLTNILNNKITVQTAQVPVGPSFTMRWIPFLKK